MCNVLLCYRKRRRRSLARRGAHLVSCHVGGVQYLPPPLHEPSRGASGLELPSIIIWGGSGLELPSIIIWGGVLSSPPSSRGGGLAAEGGRRRRRSPPKAVAAKGGAKQRAIFLTSSACFLTILSKIGFNIVSYL